MSRKPRIHYNGALYHVIVRGNNREWVFSSDNEKQRYLETVEMYQHKYGFSVYAYVVMSNHIHMLIKFGNTPLSKIMQGIQQSYTKWYNRKRKGTGHVFEQRYKAHVCHEETYLLGLIRYIHQNPQRAKLPEGLSYPWSSHAVYIGLRTCGWLDRNFPLSLFGKENAIEQYMDFMEETEETVGQVNWGQIEEGTKDNEKEEIVQQCTGNRMELNELMKKVSAYYRISEEDLRGTSRRRVVCTGRKAVVHLGKKLCGSSGKELAAALGVSETAVSKLTESAQKSEGEIEKLISLA